MVRVLFADQGTLAQLRAGSGDAPERRPVPGLADVGVLVQRIRDGGVDVRLDAPTAAEVPIEVGAAAYRWAFLPTKSGTCAVPRTIAIPVAFRIKER